MFKIYHRKKLYVLDKTKLLNIISILENKEIQTDNINKIKKYMHKYRLFDNLFLDNINRL